MWISSRVGAAEAALATVFVGGAALAVSPSRRRPTDADQPDDRDVLPPLEEPTPGSIDLSLAEAWAAVRRAATAAIMAFEDPVPPWHENDEGKPTDGAATEDEMKRDQRDSEQNTPLGDDCDCRVDGGRSQLEVEYSDVTASSSVGDLALWRDSKVSSSQFASVDFSIDDRSSESAVARDGYDQQRESSAMRKHRKSVEGTSVGTDHHTTEGERVRQPSAEPKLVESGKSAEQDAALRARLSGLRSQFNVMFEQNGGSDCVSRVKQIGDDALIGMRDTAHLDDCVVAELDDAKLILDDALRRLDAAVRASIAEKQPEYADAAAAANSVIDETKENEGSTSERAAGLIVDGSRLLAVFATKVCASALHCLEKDKDCAT